VVWSLTNLDDVGGSSRSPAAISIHCCLGTSSFSREGQSQGHEGEDKKDEESRSTIACLAIEQTSSVKVG
jgi:hypothetical protein